MDDIIYAILLFNESSLLIVIGSQFNHHITEKSDEFNF